MQVIRYKLVVALELVVHHVKEDGAVLALGALLHDLNRALMPLQ